MTMAFPSVLEEMNSRANGVLTQSTHGVDESAILCMLEQKRGQRMAKFLSTQNCPVCVQQDAHRIWPAISVGNGRYDHTALGQVECSKYLCTFIFRITRCMATTTASDAPHACHKMVNLPNVIWNRKSARAVPIASNYLKPGVRE